MKILVLNGSPRSNGNTAKMIDAFRESAEKNSHQVVCFNSASIQLQFSLNSFTVIKCERNYKSAS